MIAAGLAALVLLAAAVAGGLAWRHRPGAADPIDGLIDRNRATYRPGMGRPDPDRFTYRRPH